MPPKEGIILRCQHFIHRECCLKWAGAIKVSKEIGLPCGCVGDYDYFERQLLAREMRMRFEKSYDEWAEIERGMKIVRSRMKSER